MQLYYTISARDLQETFNIAQALQNRVFMNLNTVFNLYKIFLYNQIEFIT